MGLFDFFKRTKIYDENCSLADQKVHRSEEVNRPCFDIFFPKIVKEENAKWDDEGYLVTPNAFEDDKIDYVGFTHYNGIMNEAVCKYFGEEKCKKAAKAKRWYLSVDPIFGDMTMKNKENGWDIYWWVLHEALSNM